MTYVTTVGLKRAHNTQGWISYESDKNRSSHYVYGLTIQALIIMCMRITQSRSTIFGVIPCLLTLMETICYASTMIIVVKSQDLELVSVERQLISYR
jgi:hypothetical protein